MTRGRLYELVFTELVTGLKLDPNLYMSDIHKTTNTVVNVVLQASVKMAGGVGCSCYIAPCDHDNTPKVIADRISRAITAKPGDEL